MIISPALNWELTRKNSCFIVKRGGYEFSSDSYNLKNLHSPKYNNSFGISVTGKNKLILVQRNKKARAKSNRMGGHSVPLNAGRKPTIRTIKNIVSSFGHPELVPAAVARAKAIFRSQRIPGPMKMGRRRSQVPK